MRAFDYEQFDGAIFIPSGDNDPLLSLMRSLRRHPKHSSIPVICTAKNPEDAAAFAARGAQDFLIGSFSEEDLRARVQLATRRGRLLHAMRGFLKTCAGEQVRDPRSGAFTATFLSEHGARLCARADQTGRPLSVVAIDLAGEYNDGRPARPGAKALQKAAGLINRITRAEDVAARYASSSFLLFMPSTSVDDAQKVAMRIEGVLENTVYRDDDGETLFSVTAPAAAFARSPGVYVEELVAHAVKALRETNAAAITAPRQQSPQ